MKAMLLDHISNLRENPNPLRLGNLPIPEPEAGQVRLRVLTCGVCHTELDEIEGRTPPEYMPAVLGHQVVGVVEKRGQGASQHPIGIRVGVGWFFDSCGGCEYCLRGDENLCAEFRATGRDAAGGYAEYMTVPESSAYPVPETLSDAEAAPLLCAGAIGYRSLRLSGLQDGQVLGLTGFGASAHLVLKTVQHLYPHAGVIVFSRSETEQQFARQLGAEWAGSIGDKPPELVHCIIDTTPVWKPVVEALSYLRPGGRLVINAIRKESIDQEVLLQLSYPEHLWMEKEIKSVANVSRRDISEFLQIAARAHILPEYQEYALEDANQALYELKTGKIRGAKVLRISH